jgi:UDP-glucose 4-epimerase
MPAEPKTFPNHKGHPEQKEIKLESNWMLVSKTHLYLGAVLVFLVGALAGGGYLYQSTSLARSLGATIVQDSAPHKPTVLVTGGLGFIGSHVVEDLVANDFQVVIYDDMSNGKNFNRDVAAVLVKDITVVDDYDYIVHKIDYIVHLAAAISVEESTRLPEKYERINIEGSRKVLDWALKNGVKRVVAASSGATYGTPRPEDIPLKEESATGGICAYATTKFDMEKVMNEYNKKFGLPSTALRFFNVYGPRQDPHSSYSGVVSWMMEQAKINGTIKVTGDGEQYRDFVYVKDVARAIRTAMLLGDSDFDVFNVCTGVKTTIKEVASLVVEKFGSSAAIVNVPFRSGDVKESVGSPDKASGKLGFTAGYSFSEGITETRDWFLSL